jgi:hypothetical protein
MIPERKRNEAGHVVLTAEDKARFEALFKHRMRALPGFARVMHRNGLPEALPVSKYSLLYAAYRRDRTRIDRLAGLPTPGVGGGDAPELAPELAPEPELPLEPTPGVAGGEKTAPKPQQRRK